VLKRALARGAVLLVLASAVALVPTGSGLASSQFAATFQLNYLRHHPGASTGLNTIITWSDPGEPGGAPKPIQEIVLKLQRGTRIDTSALPACEASDEEIKNEGASACPAASRLGSGHTDARFESGAGFHTDVTLFNARGQIIVLVTLHGTTTTVTEFRDQVKGRTITVKPALPPGVSLTRLSLRVNPHSSGTGEQRRVYMTAPPACPVDREWSVLGRFTYADASTQTFKTTSRCASARRG
jgi:hypothetical protein